MQHSWAPGRLPDGLATIILPAFPLSRRPWSFHYCTLAMDRNIDITDTTVSSVTERPAKA